MKNVYIIFAADSGDGDAYALDAYSVADSYEVAEQIAQKDEADGQIMSGWHIQEMKLNTQADV